MPGLSSSVELRLRANHAERIARRRSDPDFGQRWKTADRPLAENPRDSALNRDATATKNIRAIPEVSEVDLDRGIGCLGQIGGWLTRKGCAIPSQIGEGELMGSLRIIIDR